MAFCRNFLKTRGPHGGREMLHQPFAVGETCDVRDTHVTHGQAVGGGQVGMDIDGRMTDAREFHRDPFQIAPVFRGHFTEPHTAIQTRAEAPGFAFAHEPYHMGHEAPGFGHADETIGSTAGGAGKVIAYGAHTVSCRALEQVVISQAVGRKVLGKGDPRTPFRKAREIGVQQRFVAPACR